MSSSLDDELYSENEIDSDSSFDEVQEIDRHYVGKMSDICVNCSALFFKDERTGRGNFRKCCDEGDVPLDLMLLKTPEYLKTILLDKNKAEDYHKKSRIYNNKFCMTSFVAKSQSSNRFGQYYFKVSGQRYHTITSTLQPGNNGPKFAQLYILDRTTQALEREDSSLDQDIMKAISDCLQENNKYVNFFDTLPLSQSIREVEYQDFSNYNPDRTYTLPASDMVAGLMPLETLNYAERCIEFNETVLKPDRNGVMQPVQKLKRMNQNDARYDPLQYITMFPYGEDGYNLSIFGRRKRKKGSNDLRNISHSAYYRFRMFDRPIGNVYGWHVPRMGRLYHQYLVDAYMKSEESRLYFIKQNQNKFKGVPLNELRLGSLERHEVILPASFVGSPRHMHTLYRNSMAIIRKKGKPTFFLTMTTNPHWREITETCKKLNVSWTDRPDIVCRVFQMKLNALIEKLKQGVLGPYIAHFYSVEFQKRGLPHAHIILISKAKKESVDDYICAELPKRDTNLWYTITGCQLHGPCGEYCKRDTNFCRFGYPKEFQQNTTITDESYPTYRRRDDNCTYNIGNRICTNKDVVAYNPSLSAFLDCHLNVELVSEMSVVKYIYKYIYKGYDKSEGLLTDDKDEIRMFVNSRYISASEASWRLLEYPIHQESIAVINLPIHLEGEQKIYGQDDIDLTTEVDEKRESTMLTSFFLENASFIYERNRFTYAEFPEHYTWNNQTKRWNKRKQVSKTIGSLPSLSPKSGEAYYLRLLLNIVKGPRKFEDIRVFNNITYNTYRECCVARGMFREENYILETLQEMIREIPNISMLFSSISLYFILNQVFKADSYLNKVKEELHLNIKGVFKCSPEETTSICNYLLHIEFEKNNELALETFGLALDFDAEIIKKYFQTNIVSTPTPFDFTTLNTEQKLFFDAVTNTEETGPLYLDGPGGTGKSYVIKACLSFFQQHQKDYIICAPTGIAATMFEKGQTFHSAFRVSERDVLLSPSPEEKQRFKTLSFIIIDEISMLDRELLENLNKMLQKIRKVTTVFGGIKLLCSGDFRQLLPVLSNQSNSLDSSCIFSELRPYFKRFKLKKKMRVSTSAKKWKNYLLKIGDGSIKTVGSEKHPVCNLIKLPSTCNIVDSLSSMIYAVFGLNLEHPENMILCTTNNKCKDVNNYVLNLLNENQKNYVSKTNTVDDIDIEPEVLENMEEARFPPHVLELKVGCVVMILRNISDEKKNGTRVLITKLNTNSIIGNIITDGPYFNKETVIFRVTLFNDKYFGFKIARTQFPIQLAYAVTVHKSQCQSINKIGLYIEPHEIFTHGMLYVALSRAKLGDEGIFTLYQTLQNWVYKSLVE